MACTWCKETDHLGIECLYRDPENQIKNILDQFSWITSPEGIKVQEIMKDSNWNIASKTEENKYWIDDKDDEKPLYVRKDHKAIIFQNNSNEDNYVVMFCVKENNKFSYLDDVIFANTLEQAMKLGDAFINKNL